MSKKISQIKRIYISIQFLILVIVTLCVIFFITDAYIKRSSELWKRNLDQTARFVANELINKQKVSLENVGNYVIFVINQSDGSYIFQRKARSIEDAQMWESYHSMLIYQMQKQKQGWVTYPKNSSKQASRMIRYLPIEKLGWVVAVEAVMDSNLDIIRSVFDWDVGIRILFILLIALYILRFLTHRNFSIVKKIIADNLENSFMNLSNEDIWGATNAERKIAEKVGHNALKDSELFSGGIERSRDDFGEPVLSKEKVETESIKSIPEFDIPQIKEKNSSEPDVAETESVAENFEKEKKFSKPAFEEESSPVKKEFKPVKVKEEMSHLDIIEDDSSLDDLKIDVQGIKSPILKKMIKELREKE